MHQDKIATWDGISLFYHAWNIEKAKQKALILFHGGHEHSGRFTSMIEMLDLKDYMCFACDARGHGRSDGVGDYSKSFDALVKDADIFIKHVLNRYSLSMANVILLGHSLGGLVVASYVMDYNPGIQAMILSSPIFKVRTYVPFDRFFLGLLERLRPSSYVNSYVVASMLTHDKKEIEERRRDPLIRRPIGTKMLLSAIEEGERLIQRASEIRIPTLILSAGTDWVAHLSAEKEFFKRIGSPSKEMIVYPGFFHEILHEQDRHKPIQKIRSFLETI